MFTKRLSHYFAFLPLISLSILSGLQASFIQLYGFIPLHDMLSMGYTPSMFVANTVFAFCLFSWRRSLAVIFIVLQCVISACIFLYVQSMGAQPTLMALVNGTSVALQMGWGLLSFVDGKVVLAFAALCALMIILRYYTVELAPKTYAISSLCALSIFIFIHYANHNVKSYTILSPKNTAQLIKKADYHSIRESNARRGYAMTALIQLCTGILHANTSPIMETACSPAPTATLPLAYKGKRVVLLQVESLGWELLSTRVQGQPVMPYLSNIAQQSLLLRLDGIKKLGSVNSDYELLTAKDAVEQLLYYDHLEKFPDSLLLEARKQGYDRAVVHGLTGQYMSRRRAYSHMGVEKQYFTEEFHRAGYTSLKPFDGMVRDEDLFIYGKKILRELQEPAILFIITISMHEPHLVPANPAYAESPYARFYSACAYTDAGIQNFVQSAPPDTTFIIYGDHNAYWGERSGYIPLMVYTPGKAAPDLPISNSVLTRCEAGHYLRRFFDFAPLPLTPTVQCPEVHPIP